MAALPFCRVRLSAAKPLPAAYPRKLKTLGDHLRARRLEAGLLQRDLAKLLGASVASLGHWELGNASPATRFLPATLRFLGGDPRPLPGETFPARLRALRTGQGLSQQALAGLLGIDPGTVARLEAGKGRSSGRLLRLLTQAAQPELRAWVQEILTRAGSPPRS